MAATFNQEQLDALLGRNTYELPAFAQLSKFVDVLEEANRKMARENIDSLQREQVLRNLMLKQEEKFNSLSYKERKKLLDQQAQNIKREKENLKNLKNEKEAREKAGFSPEQLKELTKAIEDLEASISANDTKSISQLSRERKGLDKNSEQYKELTEQIKQIRADRREAAAEGVKDHIAKKLGVEREEGDTKKDTAGKILSASIEKLAAVADSYFKQAEDILTQYNAKITARLEGSGKQYTDLSKVIRQNLSVSTIAKQTDVLQNLSRLVDSGIAYNLEQRAFLATVKDDIAQTFDAFDSSLLQMIRLQRTDSTMARMGLESSLQSFFNENFLDTSYLTDLRKSVSGALIDVESTMVNEEAAQFEYIVQKWLGSLYSMGASSSLVSQIASGLNMLGTGNVQGLAGSSMQTLFAMAANRSGQSYADLLTGGLTASNTNDLLKSMVEYLSEISEATKNNRVVSGAYNSIFNMTQADLRAIRNVSSDISTIYKSNINYNTMQNMAGAGLTNLATRIPLQQRAKTLMENLKFSAAENIINNPALYYTLMATNFIEDMTGGINFEAAPFGIGISGTMTGLIKSGLFGLSFLSEVLGNLDKLGSPGNIGSEFLSTNPGTMRGTGINLSARSGTSMSYTAGGSDTDIKNQNFDNISKQQKEVTEGIKGEDSETITMDDLFYGLFSTKNQSGELSTLNTYASNISTMLTSSFVPDLNAQRVIITGFNLGDTNSLLEFPVKFGAIGSEQLRGHVSNLATSIKGSDESTLYMLLALLMQVLAENGAVNVNLASSSLPLTDLVTGKGTPESTTKQPNGGNGFPEPQTLARSSAGKRAVAWSEQSVLRY